jgi:hypothetical protein
MATITDAKDDSKIPFMAVLTIAMEDGTIVTRSVLKQLIDTEEKAKAFLTSLEKIKSTPVKAPVKVADLAFLKGTKSL